MSIGWESVDLRAAKGRSCVQPPVGCVVLRFYGLRAYQVTLLLKGRWPTFGRWWCHVRIRSELQFKRLQDWTMPFPMNWMMPWNTVAENVLFDRADKIRTLVESGQNGIWLTTDLILHGAAKRPLTTEFKQVSDVTDEGRDARRHGQRVVSKCGRLAW